jgi:hypothetical protein
MAATPLTTDTPTAKSGISNGIRISLSFIIALTVGIFMMLWDGNFIPHSGIPDWIGAFVFIPLLATVLGLGSNCLVQQLSCGNVQWGAQFQRIIIVPLPFILTWGLLYLMPGMRWPIEGLVQGSLPEVRRGLSSGFYAFWVGLYTQSVLTGLAQICPK